MVLSTVVMVALLPVDGWLIIASTIVLVVVTDGWAVTAVTVVLVPPEVEGWVVMVSIVVAVPPDVEGWLVILSTVVLMPPLDNILLAVVVVATCVASADCNLPVSALVVAINNVKSVPVPSEVAVMKSLTEERATPRDAAIDRASSDWREESYVDGAPASCIDSCTAVVDSMALVLVAMTMAMAFVMSLLMIVMAMVP